MRSKWFVTLAHGCLQKLRSKFHSELKTSTLLDQTELFGTKEKSKMEPLFAHAVCGCLFSIQLCARIVCTHTTRLFFRSSTLQPRDTRT